MSGEPLSYCQLAVIVAAGGTLGGMAQALHQLVFWSQAPVTNEQLLQESRFRNVSFFGIKEDIPPTHLGVGGIIVSILLGISIGMAGAFALVGVFCLIDVFRSESDLVLSAHGFAKLFGVSVLGGFVARRALPVLGDNVMRRVKDTENQVIDARSRLTITESNISSSNEAIYKANADVEELKKTNDNQKKRIDYLNTVIPIERAKSALFNLDKVDHESWAVAFDGIKHLFNEQNHNRRAAILYARFLILRRRGDTTPPDLEGAINVLSQFLNTNTSSKSDRADVLFNRACYHVRLMNAAPDDAAQAQHLHDALEDLNRSVELKESNKKVAVGDPDFSVILRDPRFLKIVSPVVPTPKP